MAQVNAASHRRRSLAIIVGFLVWNPPGHKQFDIEALEVDIQRGIHEQSSVSVRAQCPTAPTIKEGASFECLAKADTGGTYLVHVRIQDKYGSYVWEVVR